MKINKIFIGLCLVVMANSSVLFAAQKPSETEPVYREVEAAAQAQRAQGLEPENPIEFQRPPSQDFERPDRGEESPSPGRAAGPPLIHRDESYERMLAEQAEEERDLQALREGVQEGYVFRGNFQQWSEFDAARKLLQSLFELEKEILSLALRFDLKDFASKWETLKKRLDILRPYMANKQNLERLESGYTYIEDWIGVLQLVGLKPSMFWGLELSWLGGGRFGPYLQRFMHEKDIKIIPYKTPIWPDRSGVMVSDPLISFTKIYEWYNTTPNSWGRERLELSPEAENLFKRWDSLPLEQRMRDLEQLVLKIDKQWNETHTTISEDESAILLGYQPMVSELFHRTDRQTRLRGKNFLYIYPYVLAPANKLFDDQTPYPLLYGKIAEYVMRSGAGDDVYLLTVASGIVAQMGPQVTLGKVPSFADFGNIMKLFMVEHKKHEAALLAEINLQLEKRLAGGRETEKAIVDATVKNMQKSKLAEGLSEVVIRLLVEKALKMRAEKPAVSSVATTATSSGTTITGTRPPQPTPAHVWHGSSQQWLLPGQ